MDSSYSGSASALVHRQRSPRRDVVVGPGGSQNPRVLERAHKFLSRSLGVRPSFQKADYQQLLSVFTADMRLGKQNLTSAISVGGFAGHELYRKVQKMHSNQSADRVLHIGLHLEYGRHISLSFKDALHVEVLLQLCQAAELRPQDLINLLQQQDSGEITDDESSDEE